MSYFDVVLETLQGIQKELKATRHAILHQTKLMQESKETPKEAAPAPKAISWREAVWTLRDLCKANRYCADCPAEGWCKKALPDTEVSVSPWCWEVPVDE